MTYKNGHKKKRRFRKKKSDHSKLVENALSFSFKKSEGLVELAKLVRDQDSQIELYQRAIKIDKNPLAQLNLAKIKFSKKNYQAATRSVNQLKAFLAGKKSGASDNLIVEALKLEIEIQRASQCSGNLALLKQRKQECRSLFLPQTKSILCFAPRAPEFNQNSGGNRLFEILKILRTQLKYDVVFMTCEATEPEHVEALESLGIRVVVTWDISKSLKALKSEGRDFEWAIVCWWTAGQVFIPEVRSVYPAIRIIVDSVDIHWVREERGNCSSNEKKQAEKNVYFSSDLVWVVTEEDRKHLIKECGTRVNVKLLSNIHREEVNSFQGSKDLCFIGGFNHPPNIDAAVNSAKIVKRFVRETGADVKLYIVGHNPPKEVRELHNGKNIFVTGQVECPQKYLKKSRALIAPLTWGAGIKGKICQAVMNKVPVITTDIGNEGIDLINQKEGFIANSIEEFITCLKLIYSLDDRFLADLTERAFLKVNSITSEENARRSLETTFKPRSVVISILTFNNAKLLLKCVKSVIEKTLYPNYKIVITANGCVDDTEKQVSKLIETYPNVKIELIKKRRNEFFIRPNNEIFSKYKNCDVVLLNDDVEVLTKCWLTQLNLAAYSAPNIACAGGKNLYPDGTLYAHGSKILFEQKIVEMKNQDIPDRNCYNTPGYVDYLPGCLLYIRRDAILRIGDLDELFYPMYFEEKDWQYRAHLQGLKTIYEPKCVAIHVGAATSGKFKAKYIAQNCIKFRNRYSGVKFKEFGYLIPSSLGSENKLPEL